MELIYIWINKTEIGNYLEREGICFSSKYIVDFSYSDKMLSVKSQRSQTIDLFKNDTITNVTAIVGKNGGGKTTLLNYIFDNDVMPLSKEERDEYSSYFDNHDNLKKSLQIFEYSDGTLQAFHNLDFDICSDNCTVINVNNKDMYDFRSELENKSNFHSITKINLTNSYYTKNEGHYIELGNPSKVALNIHSLNTLKNGFYRKLVNLPQGMIEVNHYNKLQDMIISNRSSQDFQAVCDLLYFDKLIMSGNTTFSGKVVTSISVNFLNAASFLNKMEIKTPKSFSPKDNVHEFTEQKIKKWDEFTTKLERKSDSIVLRCTYNLLFELHFIEVINVEEISTSITCEELHHFIKKSLDTSNFDENNYYLNALAEIENFKHIIIETEVLDNRLPPEDSAYEKYWVLDKDKNLQNYKLFLEFVKSCAFSQSSFILKYMLIRNLEMSSGERAYLNFFSWVNMLDFFKHIDKNIIESTKDNIILLIDEIELYCHPEWQRKFLKYLIEEITVQFKGKKVQIIFATHSPIILSDMPHTNIVYLEEGKIVTNNEKTFAQNIHMLFCDSFYLNESIGEFALTFITSILKSLKENDFSESFYDYCKRFCELVGEPVLIEMLRRNIEKYAKKKSNSDNNKVIKAKEVIREMSLIDRSNLLEYIKSLQGDQDV